jgi:protein disulfide-isomerase A6
MAQVDVTEHQALGSKYEIEGFPTLKWFEGSGVDDYNGGRKE